MMIRVFCFFVFFATGGLAHAQSDSPPEILATIKPLHSLVQGVLGDTATAGLLLDNTATPHDFQMKPSQVRGLYHARVLFYIDPQFEQFLQRVLADLPAEVLQVPVAQESKITLAALRGGRDEDDDDHEDDHDDGDEHGDEHEDDHKDEHEDKHDHDSGGQDYHIWLDPNNAAEMVRTIADALARAYPQNRAIYQSNAAAMIAKILALHAELETALAPVQDLPFIVFHDAYGYFERAYNLHPPAVVALDETVPPSPKRISQLRERLRQTGARCLFREPQFSDKVLAVIRDGSAARMGTLDPLGAGLTAGEELYFSLLRDLAGALKKCLSAS